MCENTGRRATSAARPGMCDLFGFLCFQNSFVLGEPYACDCDPDPSCDIFDFLCFQNAFVAGCP
ncbi:MAG: hypothetical protein IID31_09230 [Planctomycetes bacterium]|nr:hypothetical protein [Planctomycetota bacterium]